MQRKQAPLRLEIGAHISLQIAKLKIANLQFAIAALQ